ncbi:MAG: hypothetical protein GY906_22780 [bacterium]|nr:hypothetical protein [bacterium]
METETTYTPEELASELAKVTGDNWQCDESAPFGARLSGGPFPIWFRHGRSGWREDQTTNPDREPVAQDRVEFHPCWPGEVGTARSYSPRDIYGDSKPDYVSSITVATRRGPAVAAKEIARRLINPNLAMLAAIEDCKAADEAHATGKRALVERLAAALGKPAPKEDGHNPNDLSAHDITFSVNGPDSITLKSYSLPAAKVLAIVGALKAVDPATDGS